MRPESFTAVDPELTRIGEVHLPAARAVGNTAVRAFGIDPSFMQDDLALTFVTLGRKGVEEAAQRNPQALEVLGSHNLKHRTLSHDNLKTEYDRRVAERNDYYFFVLPELEKTEAARKAKQKTTHAEPQAARTLFKKPEHKKRKAVRTSFGLAA